MQFFKLSFKSEDDRWKRMQKDNNRILEQSVIDELNLASHYRYSTNKNNYVFVSLVHDETIEISGVISDDSNPVDEFYAFVKEAKIDITKNYIKKNLSEITMGTIKSDITRAYKYSLVDEDIQCQIFSKFNLNELFDFLNSPLNYSETIVDKLTKKQAYEMADNFFTSPEYVEELDRIYYDNSDNVFPPSENIKSTVSTSKKPLKFPGHPVHYIIYYENMDTMKKMSESLVAALYSKNRVRSRRVCALEMEDVENSADLTRLYKENFGGTIILKNSLIYDGPSNNYQLKHNNWLNRICNISKRFQKDVLTIFCIPIENERLRKSFMDSLFGLSVIEMHEECAENDSAIKILRNIAAERNTEADDKLLALVEPNKRYTFSELDSIYNVWYSFKLKKEIYPQYCDNEPIQQEESKPQGSAYDDLQNMIGLESVKKIIEDAIIFNKAQKMYADKGITEKRPSMHMIFTGNPGTAKTTVARIFAEIMQENGVLSSGHIVEVGRSDLVAQYVGQTAPKIKKKFRRAMGGVLFIDEAYSLIDDREGSFGDEAIHTIVQEMENHRDDVVVIFAGYPDKMKMFLDRNPGLRSRIAFHVNFDDYNADELTGIASYEAGKLGLTLTDDAKAKIHNICEDATGMKDFGNGRFVRNIIEKSRMLQARRLVQMDYDRVTREDVTTLEAEDIVAPEPINKPEHAHIGFCAG